MKPVLIPLAKIRTDGNTQSRAATNADLVSEYAAAMGEGDAFPPVVVFDDGTDLWLADGFKRVAAAAANKFPEIEADVRKGTQHDARVHSAGANEQHGERRSPQDKAAAVKLLLSDPVCATWSDRMIAEKCKVAHTFVANVRRSSVGVDSNTPRTGKDGRTYKATKAAKPKAIGDANEEQVFCTACQTKKRKGQPLPGRCAECRAANKAQGEKGGKAIKNGREAFTFHKLDEGYGICVRQVDVLAGMYDAKETPQHEGCHRLLKEFMAAFRSFHKTLTAKRAG